MRTLEELVAIITVDPIKFYKTREWRDKREEIMGRDHGECQRCAGRWKSDFPIKNIRLSKAKYVHHIQPLIEAPYLCLENDNLVSLCFSCHETVERRGFSKEKKIPLTIERW
ncbi:MAG TPA: alpha/beta hydrolase [Erysipelotrichaceae bacterium]|nr:alpha/beta hydrolase [Erysipelotrichaceae bacterium]